MGGIGATGARGSEGPAGRQGATGSSGLLGPIGPQGAPGKNMFRALMLVFIRRHDIRSSYTFYFLSALTLLAIVCSGRVIRDEFGVFWRRDSNYNDSGRLHYTLKRLSSHYKDTYKDICNYFSIWPMEQQISARQNKFQLRYCASDSAVCCAISKLS